MDEKIYCLLGIILGLIVVSEARVISRRALPKDEPSGNEEIPFSLNPLDKDNKLGDSPGIWDQPTRDDVGIHEYDAGVVEPRGPPSDFDDNKPVDGDSIDNNRPGILKPEKSPSEAENDESPIEKPKETDRDDVDTKYDTDKSRDEGFYEPLDESNKSVAKGSQPVVPVAEDKSIQNEKGISHGDKDVDEKEPEEYDDDEKNNVPIDEENDKEDEEEDEDKKHAHEDDDKVNNIPEEDDKVNNRPEEDDEDDDNVNNIPEEEDKEEYEPDYDDDESKLDKDFDEESNEQDDNDDDDDKGTGEVRGIFDGSSIFDTPFFNLGQVKNYFGQLDRALQHVFRQTLEEALLLNGTYSNTTEEEVDIDGRKYVVHKSVIKGADNHSSIYIEALTAKSKSNDTEGSKIFEIKNATET